VIAASVMLLLWLSLNLISAFPALHHWFHQDSGQSRHECLATAMSKGGVLPVHHAIHYAPAASWLVLSPSVSTFILHFVSYALPLERGPPSLSSETLS